MSSKNYAEFKETWGKLSLPELRGLNANQQFEGHRDWYERLVGELEEERATQSSDDLLKASQSHTSAINRNTLVRAIAGFVAAITLVVTLILKGQEIWDWVYNQFH